jgi:TP901 family phage tail tape measure protein
MDNQVLVNRVYSVKVTGVDASLKSFTDLNTAITTTDTAFQAVKAALQTKIDAGGTASEVAKLTTEAKKLSDQLAILVSQQQLSSKEALLLAKAETEVAKGESLSAKATLDNAKAKKEDAAAAAIKAKEDDRQLDRADKLAKAAAKTAAANNVEAESYIAVRNQMAELKPFIQGNNSYTTKTISFGGQDLNFEGAIQKFRELSATEANFRRQFATDNILVGEYSKGILHAFNEAGVDKGFFKNQKDQINNQLKELIQESRTLAQQLQQDGIIGSEAFGKVDKQLRDNIANQEKLRTSLKNIEGEFGGIGKSVTSSIADSFKNLKGQLSQVIVGYVGFQAAISGVQSIIHQNAELSDSFADLQIRLHGNKEAADEVFESLKRLDTRTSLKDLLDTSGIIAKKGVAKEEIAGITQALDNYFVVAGKEAGGRDEGVASIVKLISIFNDDKHVTKERVTELTSALIGLTTSGVATGSYLVDFAERVGSIRGITGITLPNVLGLGAAIQQLGQRSETASTASLQILTKIFADVPKYAKIAQVSVEDFRKTLKDNPFEALIQVAEKLKGGGKDFEKAAQDFEDAGVKRAGLKATLGDIASNADYVRLKMAAAATAMQNSGLVADAAKIKQETFAAAIEKIGKAFTQAFSNPSILNSMTAIANAILLVVNHLGKLIAIGAFMIVGLAAQNAELILLNAQMGWYNLMIIRNQVAILTEII